MSLGKLRKFQSDIDEENPYWLSFSDIMSGLLIIFVLASLVLVLELSQRKALVDEKILERTKAEKVRQEVLAEIKEELRRKGIMVEVSDNDTVLRIPDDQLAFESNEYRVPPQDNYQAAVLEIGRVLYTAITKENRLDLFDTIFIEGHTDKRPSPRNLGNWGLSTFRAISVWNYWNDNLGNDLRLDQLKNHQDAPLFSVSGYGDTRPVNETQETEEDYRRNRRIDLRFTVIHPKLDDILSILD
ncbi:OmpA family protein [Desulfomicrobium sp. ZS1]|uniref:OmpA/MotB family protein n=1 Tax=Desulfomicrobium sp. ZS1 TaxID=2952228 RepID=UPI0020B244DB|nr:OmpA family protein [Desulfomicrobium sp. ZS1]UTF51784.1 OmpA family protein [Desulfomicrobium sp. ZS1]